MLGMSRAYQPSIITCGRRYTRVCKVRVAQCVYIAQSGSESQTSIERAPIFVLECEAPSVPGVSGVFGSAWCTCVWRVCEL